MPGVKANDLERRTEETLARWQQYQQTGSTISHDAVTQWLNSWGEDREERN